MRLVSKGTDELERWTNNRSGREAAQLENTPGRQPQIKTKNKNCERFSNETNP